MIREQDLPCRVSGRYLTGDELTLIRGIIAENPAASRAEITRLVTSALAWRQKDGRPAVTAAIILLKKLHESRLIELPPPRTPYYSKPEHRPRTPGGEPLPKTRYRLEELLPLRLQVVTTKKERDLWSELIDRYHYLGCATFAGAQVRYLVHSPQGLVAVFGFSAAAWQVRDRDRFIGWDEDQRRRSLYLVANNSRFLILPWIRCRNLASKLLSLVARQLPADWTARYGYAPVLLETFVDQGRFWGTSYKAAGWTLVGITQGRGRQGIKARLPLKSIYLLPLRKGWRRILAGDQG
jgi:hypothetical protein